MKIVSVLLAAMLFVFVGVPESQALIIDFNFTTNVIEETEVPMTGQLKDYVQPWMNMVLTNDGQDTLNLLLSEGIYNSSGGVLTLFSEEFLQEISIPPGESKEVGFLMAGPYYFNFNNWDWEPCKVGDFATVTSLSLNFNDGDFGIYLDDPGWTVTVIEADNGASPVPEPATMILFGTGLAGLAAVGRRRKNQ